MFLRILYATIAILVVIIGYKTFGIYSARKAAEKAPVEEAVGNLENANLNIVLFFDYQCPYCKDIYPTVKEAVEEDGNVKMVIRLLPSMGDESMRIGRLAYAAGMQGKFREIHNILLKHYGPFDNSDLKRAAEQAGLDLEQWLQDSESEAIFKRMNKNIEVARKLKVYATPTFLIGRLIYTPVDKLPEKEDFLRLFAEARGSGGV